METFFVGIAIIIMCFILKVIINPVGGVSTAILDGGRFIGVVVIAVSTIQWIASDDIDNEPIIPDEMEKNVYDEPSSLSEDNNKEDDDDNPSSTNVVTVPVYPNSTVTPEIEVTHRYPCRVCKNTGICNMCNGTGQTKTRLVEDYELGVKCLEYEDCNSCGGWGKCSSCQGDGWLDEGSEF